MKIVMLEGTERDSKIKREVEVLQMLVNPCIIRIRDSFEHQKKLYIIMDYAAGNGIYIYIYIIYIIYIYNIDI